jgi:predicted secreted protein
MRLGTAVAIYFIIWWVMLFVTLPFGAKSAHEAGEQVGPGHAPSAPLRPMMVRKVIATSILAALAFAAYWWASERGLMSPETWTFFDL